jgi:3'-5' exonuclease
MDDYLIAWDIETVPDLSAVARAHDLEEHDIAAARAVLGEKFPKHPWHQIVCIGALIAARSAEGWQVLSLGAPHVGARSEDRSDNCLRIQDRRTGTSPRHIQRKRL